MYSKLYYNMSKAERIQRKKVSNIRSLQLTHWTLLNLVDSHKQESSSLCVATRDATIVRSCSLSVAGTLYGGIWQLCLFQRSVKDVSQLHNICACSWLAVANALNKQINVLWKHAARRSIGNRTCFSQIRWTENYFFFSSNLKLPLLAECSPESDALCCVYNNPLTARHIWLQ